MKTNTKLVILIVVFAVAVIVALVLTVNHYTHDSYMVLNGEEKTVIGLNGLYDDPGATAVINGKDVSDQIKVTGKPDSSIPGKYDIVYSAGNFTVTRQVTVTDTMDPVIELKGADKDISLTLGDEFKDPGYTATDSEGNDITAEVEVTGADFNRAGKQLVAYTVTDSQGKTTRVYRTVKIKPNTEYGTSGLPICMYQYVYDDDNPPDNLHSNSISTSTLSEELAWLNEHDYYYPTWQEVVEYLNGELLLPEKSVVLTFDSASSSFFKYGLPLLEKYKVPATCFIVTSKAGNKISQYESQYLSFQSNSDNMHRGGGDIGHGGIFTKLSKEEALADLKKSIEITGNKDVFAYPFGDYNDECKKIVEEAGFSCAVTTRQGRAKPGDDPYSLPRQRMGNDQTMDTFRALVLPY